MKLHEKILYCRKRAGLSQEALAESVGVSRQAVSKWETGESVPETGKLAALAAALGVSVDWLLSEDEPERPRYEYGGGAHPGDGGERGEPPRDWTESLPRLLRRAARRWGWLAGVYLALCGLPPVVIGALASGISGRMLESFGGLWPGSGAFGSTIQVDGVNIPLEGTSFGSVEFTNPVAMLGDAMVVIGVLLMAAGAILALVLKKRSEK